MLFKHVEKFYKQSTFYSGYKEFLVAGNSFSFFEKLNTINTTNSSKKVSTYGFSSLYTTITHNLIINVLSEIKHFVLNRKFVVK